jgi:hypothetical protein
MQITRNFLKEHNLREHIWKNRKKYETKIQSTDLVNCLRKAWFRLNDINLKVKPRFEFAIIEKTLQIIMEDTLKFRRKVIMHPKLKIACNIKIASNVPIEFKTIRKNINDFKEIPRSHIEQLQLYMTAMETQFGSLLILNVVNADLQFYSFYLSETDYVKAVKKFWERKNFLKQALESRDYTILPKLEYQCETCESKTRCY